MLNGIKDWLMRVMGLESVNHEASVTEFVEDYEDVAKENITAVIAGRLSALTIGDSSISVNGDGLRASLLREILSPICEGMQGLTSQSFGKGGKLLIPLYNDGEITIAAIDQSRVSIHAYRGGKPVNVSVLADETTLKQRKYYRILNYSLMQDGTQWINQHVVDDMGNACAMSTVPGWERMTESICITGTKQLLMGWLKCPRDARGNVNAYGVPITYGAGQELDELVEHIRWYRREFKLSRAMLGMDATLWRNLYPGEMDIGNLKRTVQDDESPFVPVAYDVIGEGKQWQHFAPDIRYEAFEERLGSLQSRLEKACGLSAGILTNHTGIGNTSWGQGMGSYHTKDEIRTARYDSFSVVAGMRRNIEKAVRDTCEACDVLCERFGLSPYGALGQYSIGFDWDMSLLESTTETFEQMSVLHERGLISDEKLTAWVLGTSEEGAKLENVKARNNFNAGLALQRKE